MGFTIKPIEKGQYVLFCIGSETTLNDLETVRQELAEMLRGRGWSRIMTDARDVTLAMSVSAQFTHIARLAEAFPMGMRMAVLLAGDNEQDTGFVGTVASNRGFDLRFFTDEGQALEFLVGDSRNQ